MDSYREEDETLVVSSSLLLGSQLIVTNSTDVIIGEPRDTSIRDENNVMGNRKVDPKSNYFWISDFIVWLVVSLFGIMSKQEALVQIDIYKVTRTIMY